MRNLIYRETSFNPYHNLAMERGIFQYGKVWEEEQKWPTGPNLHENHILYLWQNAPSVIIGRNQNLYQECDLQYMRREGIKPVRRLTGGGAVYHDLGNLNFTVIGKAPQTEEGMEREDALIQQMLRKALNQWQIPYIQSERNDLLLDGCKFSGHAYLEEDGCRLYHGTLMVAADLDQMERVLTPSKLKLSSKGIESVRSRVMNLSEIDHKITIDSLAEAIENSFMEIYGSATRGTLSEIPNDESLERTFASVEWLYDSAPQYQLELEKKIPEGNVSFHLEIENGWIVKIQIDTDSLDLNLPNRLSSQWMGRKFQEFQKFICC